MPDETTDERIIIADAPIHSPAEKGTPFGERWGGKTIRLNLEHLDALKAGKTLLLDVEAEYLVNLQLQGVENAETEC